MRLQLTVERQGMVPVHLLWDPVALRPNRTEGGANITIAQLLEQINEVVPLEATEWGLEDYVAEVDGFECLHFCSLSILKEDDHISVRPLQTSDLRFRRVSGRHQISWDGKHLIDGVAFGRPFLRRPDRPAINIPPRKRVRLTYDDDDEGSANLTTPSDAQQAIVRSNSNDADNEESDDEADDGDYRLSESEGMDIASELKDLNQESEDFDRGFQNPKRALSSDSTIDHPTTTPRSQKRRRREGLGIYGGELLNTSDRSDTQYVGKYYNPLLDQYYKDDPVPRFRQSTNLNALSKFRGGGNVPHAKTSKMNPASRRSSSASLKSVRFEGEEFETPATVREVSQSEAEDEGDLKSKGSVTTDSTESNKENVQPGKKTRRLKLVNERKVESSTDLDTSSVSSDTDSESSYTSSSGDSSSDDSTESKETGGDYQDANVDISSRKPSHHPINSVEQRSVQTKQGQQRPMSVAPGLGQSKTQKRNERRRINRKIKYLQSIGVLSSTATVQDYNNWVEAREDAHSDIGPLLRTEPRAQATDTTEAFETKRKALLDSIQSGGIDIHRNSTDGNGPIDEDSIDKNSSEQSIAPISRVPHAEASTTLLGSEPSIQLHNDDRSNGEEIASAEVRTQVMPNLQATEAPHTTSSTPNVVLHNSLSTASEPTKRRAKLDLSSSRRLLFGSLGLRTPKNKDDETKLREKMMENVRPSPRLKASEDVVSNGNLDVVEDMDESWKDKIVLKAVECCYSGVELSTPPFPFVQRWDPQQQGGSAGFMPSKSKKRKRSQKHLYQETEDDYEDQSHNTTGGETDLKGFNKGSENVGEHIGVRDGSAQLPEDDELQNAVDKQLMGDNNRHNTDPTPIIDTVPLLLRDESTLDRLTRETALPGATIIFQQLEMSQETNWQPTVSESYTAIITNILDNDRLELSLTQRRWPISKKLYDTTTGERLYSKFEMPDYENDEYDKHDGMIDLGFTEMIEPRLVKAADYLQTLQEHIPFDKPDIETIDMSEMPDVDEDLEILVDIERNPSIDISASPRDNDAPELPLNGTSGDLPYHVREEHKLADVHEMTEESRQEISMIIKDAGFRSNVHSDLVRGVENQLGEETLNVQEHTLEVDVELGTPEVQSPKFNGFSSSPSAKEISKQDPSDQDDSVPTITNDTTLSNIVSIEDSQSQEAQERTELPIDDVISEEWNPPQINDDSLTYPALPDQLESPKSDDHLIEKSSSPASTRITQRTRRLTRSGASVAHAKNLFSSRYGTDSDDELPTMESVLSTAPSRLENQYTTKVDNDEANSSERKKVLKFTSNSPSSTRERSNRQVPSFSVADILITSSASSVAGDDLEHSDQFLPTTSSTQPPLDSQVVDLTFSSDPVDPDESEYEERNMLKGMPRGPGWVKKTRSAGRKGEGKNLRERKIRSM